MVSSTFVRSARPWLRFLTATHQVSRASSWRWATAGVAHAAFARLSLRDLFFCMRPLTTCVAAAAPAAATTPATACPAPSPAVLAIAWRVLTARVGAKSPRSIQHRSMSGTTVGPRARPAQRVPDRAAASVALCAQRQRLRRASAPAAAAGRGAGACQPWANNGALGRDLTARSHS